MSLPKQVLQDAVQNATPHTQLNVDFSRHALKDVPAFTAQKWFSMSNYWTLNTDLWRFESRTSSFLRLFLKPHISAQLFRSGIDEENLIVALAGLPNASWNLLTRISTTSMQPITSVISNPTTTAAETGTKGQKVTATFSGTNTVPIHGKYIVEMESIAQKRYPTGTLIRTSTTCPGFDFLFVQNGDPQNYHIIFISLKTGATAISTYTANPREETARHEAVYKEFIQRMNKKATEKELSKLAHPIAKKKVDDLVRKFSFNTDTSVNWVILSPTILQSAANSPHVIHYDSPIHLLDLVSQQDVFESLHFWPGEQQIW